MGSYSFVVLWAFITLFFFFNKNFRKSLLDIFPFFSIKKKKNSLNNIIKIYFETNNSFFFFNFGIYNYNKIYFNFNPYNWGYSLDSKVKEFNFKKNF